ncbi:hypothetical protein HK104_002912, partial [Borealophlyctis nickersoniae]
MSTLATISSVYSKEQADAQFKPLGWLPDLTSYYTKWESDAITLNLASRDSVYSKFEVNQLFKPINWQPNLAPYALKTDLGDFYNRSEVDERFDSIGYSFYTRDQTDQRYMSINYTSPAPDLTGYLLRTTADTLYMSINWEPDSNVWAKKNDLLDYLPFPLAQQFYYKRTNIDANFPTKDFLSATYYTKGQSDNLLSNYWSK